MRPSRLPVTCPNVPVNPFSWVLTAVPLRMVEGIVYIRTKLRVKTFVESNILSEGDIPIVLPWSPHHVRGGSTLNVVRRHDECARIEIL